MSSSRPKPTAEQKAMERAQREQLDKETASSERQIKGYGAKENRQSIFAWNAYRAS